MASVGSVGRIVAAVATLMAMVAAGRAEDSQRLSDLGAR